MTVDNSPIHRIIFITSNTNSSLSAAPIQKIVLVRVDGVPTYA